MALDDNVISSGGWDPWWPTPAKKNSSDPHQAILWAVGPGRIFRTNAPGEPWLDVTPDEDPPNDWADATAPTVADLTFIQRADNIHANGEHYFLAEWQEAVASEWRSWILKTADDGVNWEWKSLINVDVDGDGYIYPVVSHGIYGHVTGDPSPGRVYWIESGQGQASGEADESYMQVKYYASHTFTDRGIHYSHKAAFDFGAQISGVKTVWVRGYRTPSIHSSSDGKIYANTSALWENLINNADVAGWAAFNGTQFVADTIGSATASVEWYKILTTNADGRNNFRYLALTSNVNPASAEPGAFFVDTIRVEGTVTELDTRGIWMDVDSETGEYIWLTVWKSDDTLVLQKRNTSDLGLVAEYSLGACTIAELNARTYIAYPHTPAFDADLVYCFGRMASPQGLGVTEHIIKTTDGGASWASVENTWGSDHCGALRVEPSASRIMYCVRNRPAPDNSEFYTGAEGGALTYRSDLTFAVGVGVNVDALTLLPSDLSVAVGADTAGPTMIITAGTGDTYGSWADITDSFPATGEVRSLTYV